MLKLQIGQILTLSKSDLSGLLACLQATYMSNIVRFTYTIAEKMPEIEIDFRLKEIL